MLDAFFGSATPLISTNANPKAVLRREALARREGIGPAVRAAFSRRLAEEGLRLARLWRPRIVSAFHPMRDEPDTLRAFERARRGRIRDRSAGRCRPWVVASLSPLAAGRADSGRRNVDSRARSRTAPVVDPDLLFVPLACFDRRGHRIGYGAGYYDLTLARLRATKPVHAAGVAYGVCEIAAVPYEDA